MFHVFCMIFFTQMRPQMIDFKTCIKMKSKIMVNICWFDSQIDVVKLITVFLFDSTKMTGPYICPRLFES